MLGDFWAWWLQQIGDLLHTSLLRRQATPGTALVAAPGVAAETGTLSLLTRRRGREHVIDRFPLDDASLAAVRRVVSQHRRRTPVVLRVPSELLLERDVDLPLAAEPDVDNVLRYNIDTLTPFAAHELFWNWTVMSRDRVHRNLHLRLSLICKSAVAPLVGMLQQAGAPPSLLEFRLPDGGIRTIAVADAASRGGRLRRHAPAAVAGCLAGALVSTTVLPIVFRQRELAATEAHIQALRPQVAHVEALRRRLADSADRIDVISRERARVGDAMQVIAVVTDTLPDDTWLSELTLRQRKLVLTGESAGAAKLIIALSADPLLRNPRFVAPITRAPTDGRDLFSIATEVMP
jgi:general secretion pathway protein L